MGMVKAAAYLPRGDATPEVKEGSSAPLGAFLGGGGNLLAAMGASMGETDVQNKALRENPLLVADQLPRARLRDTLLPTMAATVLPAFAGYAAAHFGDVPDAEKLPYMALPGAVGGGIGAAVAATRGAKKDWERRKADGLMSAAVYQG